DLFSSFYPSVVPSVYTIYMGKDKYENEDLIKYGWPEDIWFHVDKLSSAHVYLRLHKGQTVDDIPKEVLIDCAHLVKANSIQGNTDSREIGVRCLRRVFLVHTSMWFFWIKHL
uniref:Coiled-coil domain-containing protein 25 n=1 Tax=Buteo japonicus TaxID=224669 RepID=A0A8B9Z5G0_9AVES